MKLKKNKKGSHVGLVLSFVLFITFIIFIHQILTPNVKRFDKNSEILESFEKKVLEEVSDEVYIIRVNDVFGGGAKVTHSQINLNNVVGFDYQGNEIPAEAGGTYTDFEGPGGFTTLFYNENFVSTTGSPSTGSDVSIGNVLVENRILETKILDLINLINVNYTLARETLDIVGEQEFDVQFKYENGTWIKGGNDKEFKTNIYSKTFTVNYLNINAKEEVGEILVKVW